ncbi:MAG: hypothetical protein AAF441_07510 [Pseudomonadota bacterium]
MMKVLKGVLLSAAVFAVSPQMVSASEGAGKPICGQDFKGVPELLKEIRALPGARVVTEDTFYLAIQHPATRTVWTFTGQAHPAQPSVICRRPVKDADGKLTLKMEVRCGAPRADCDALVDSFKKLNAQMIERMQKSSQ